jgi:hypothetical protein
MTNGADQWSKPSFGSTVWGGGFPDTAPLNVGIRQSTNFIEGAEGKIDDVKVFKNETWSSDQFNYDYAVIIPDDGCAADGGASMIFFARRRRTAMNRPLSVSTVLLIGAFAGAARHRPRSVSTRLMTTT